MLGLTLQADGRFLFDEEQTVPDTFTIRKARPTLSGQVPRKSFDFQIMPDFGAGVATLQDAYIDVRFSPRFRVRSGKDKTPIGYELLEGDPYLLFPERSLASNLVPNRDVGVQAQGDLSPRFTYSGGIFNGVPDSTNSSTDVDTNGSKDAAWRVVWAAVSIDGRADQPAERPGFPPRGIDRRPGGGLARLQGGLGQQYFSYAADAAADGHRDRITAAVFYYCKSFGGFAEYVRSAQDVGRSGSTFEIANQGWDVTGSFSW